MHCLLLGGGGFIGSAIADELLGAGHRVRIFERSNVPCPEHRKSQRSVEWMSGDFLQPADIARAVAGVDAVIHLVSTTLPKSSNDDPVFDIQSNVCGTLNLLTEMVKHGVRRIVFASSGGTVYGVPVHTPILEDHSTNPQVSYGISKLAIEKYLGLFQKQYGLEPVVLRVANPYGWGQRLGVGQGAVGEFIHRALSGEHIEIWGDGSVVRDYLYVSDVASAFRLALDYRGLETVFNVGSGVGTSLNDLISVIEQVVGHPIERKYLRGRAFDVPVSVLDISRARRELDWAPEVSIMDGLEKTIAWFSSNRAMPAHTNASGMPARALNGNA